MPPAPIILLYHLQCAKIVASFPGLPCFVFFSLHSVQYTENTETERKPKNTKWRRPGNKARIKLVGKAWSVLSHEWHQCAIYHKLPVQNKRWHSLSRTASGKLSTLQRFKTPVLEQTLQDKRSQAFPSCCKQQKTSLIPRPCAFVTCSMKFAQRAWAHSSRDACCSLRHNHSTRINDVIDELAPCLPLKEAPQDHSKGSRANLPKC